MSGTNPFLVLFGALALFAAILAAILVPLVRWARRATALKVAEIAGELAAAGERVLVAPAPAVYRGATGDGGLPRARGNGAAALGERRLVVRRLVGAGIEVKTADIVGVREDKWFARAYAGQQHVIVQLRDGGELGLFVRDHPAWMSALRRLTGS
ncbi:MAG: hypothetical protein JNL82_31010 [Myxococcales bacterium]|nr:hypothetical protein [Myxococcales bacterium]